MVYLWNNIASLAIIPIVLAVVFKLKGAQIDSLKQQNETLKSQVDHLKDLRPSGMAAEYEAVKKFADKTTKQLQNAKEEMGKLKIKIKQKEQLDEKDIDLVSSVVGLTQGCLSHYASGWMDDDEHLKYSKEIREDIYPKINPD